MLDEDEESYGAYLKAGEVLRAILPRKKEDISNSAYL
jgi:hypothetical protein